MDRLGCICEKTALEHQITGQMSIEEVLAEWEKTKYAAEVALEDAKQRRLESAKARALQGSRRNYGTSCRHYSKA